MIIGLPQRRALSWTGASQALALRACALSALQPSMLASLTGLQRLDLSFNALVDLPAGFSTLQALRQLSLAGNSFPRLPEVKQGI